MKVFRLMETLGERVRRLRKGLGWTEARLEVESGVSARHIQRIESGETPTPRYHTLMKLASALGVSIATLMGGGDEKPIQKRAEAVAR